MIPISPLRPQLSKAGWGFSALGSAPGPEAFSQEEVSKNKLPVPPSERTAAGAAACGTPQGARYVLRPSPWALNRPLPSQLAGGLTAEEETFNAQCSFGCRGLHYLLYAASHHTLAAGAARGQDDWLGTISTLGCGLQLLLDDRLVNRLLDGVVLRCLR